MSDTELPPLPSAEQPAAPTPQQPGEVPVDECDEIRELLSHYLSAAQRNPARSSGS